MKLLQISIAALFLAIPTQAFAGCDDVYRNALINHLRDRSQYATYSGLEQTLTHAVQDSVNRNSSFSLSAIVEGIPVGGAFSSQGARDLRTLLTDTTSVVISETLLTDVASQTGNSELALAYNECVRIERVGLELEPVSFNPDVGQVTINLIKTGGSEINILSVDYDRSEVSCRSPWIPRRRPILITSTPSYICSRTRSGYTALPITIITDAGSLSFSLPANRVRAIPICRRPRVIAEIFYSFGEATMNVHKIPHDPTNGYYVNLAGTNIEAAVNAMRNAGFSSDLYESPMIAQMRRRVETAPRGSENDAYNVRTDIANEIFRFESFLMDRVRAACSS